MSGEYGMQMFDAAGALFPAVKISALTVVALHVGGWLPIAERLASTGWHVLANDGEPGVVIVLIDQRR